MDRSSLRSLILRPLNKINGRHFYERAIPVLCYHSTPNRTSFAMQMRTIRESGLTVISLKELIDWMEYRAAPTLPAVAITFDDCYQDQFANAVPVLRDFGYSATFFGVTHWIDKRSSPACSGEVPTIPLMGPDEVRKLRKLGFEVGCHSRTHRPLRDLRPDELQSETAIAKRELENILWEPVRFFCYPYGQYTHVAIASVKAGGFWAAVSTKIGAVQRGDDRFIVKRLCVPASAGLEEFNAQLTWIPQVADIVHRVPHLDKVARVWWNQG